MRGFGNPSLCERCKVEGGDDVVDAAGEDFRKVVPIFLQAVVGDAVLKEVVGADFLGAVAGADLRLALRCVRHRLFFFL